MNLNKITLSTSELIEEHERLINLLYKTINELTNEYNLQLKELQQYKQLYGNGFDKVRYVMHEFKRGNLHDSIGRRVIDPRQALAIALSEQRRYSS
jgi:hypothetical protein